MNIAVRDLFERLRPLQEATRERHAATSDHNHRTVPLAVEIGHRCGHGSVDLDLLRVAAWVHDIGKIGIPDRILLKPTSFTAAEREIMETHPERGYRLISTIDSEYAEPVATTVRHHHEHFDGSGYPDRISGEDIPLLSRILSIADSYDALAAPRTYHPAKSHARIMDTLHGENRAYYDPDLLQLFTDIIEDSPHRSP